jgi:hypothetical protein
MVNDKLNQTFEQQRCWCRKRVVYTDRYEKMSFKLMLEGEARIDEGKFHILGADR